eukprot:gene3022-3582_t
MSVLAQGEYVMHEKAVLTKLSGHQGIVELVATLQTPDVLGLAPSVPTVLDGFVLGYCPNGDLQEMLAQATFLPPATAPGKRIPEAHARLIAAQLFDAVRYIHSHGVVHRDIKPENVLFDQNWRARLCDFVGCRTLGSPEPGAEARTAYVNAAQSHTEQMRRRRATRVFVGTPQYSAPEVLECQHGCVGPSADYWSLGCILFHMLAGISPFHADSEYLVMTRVRAGDVSYPSDFPVHAETLCSALLPLDPQARLQDPKLARESPFLVLSDWSFSPENLCVYAYSTVCRTDASANTPITPAVLMHGITAAADGQAA